MRRLSFVLLLTLPLAVAGCARTTDNFKPRITIDSAVGVAQEKSFLVEGYALDDVGVTEITVDGQSIPILPGSRKLARFQFKTLIQGESGKYTITARDAAGNKTKLELPITVDAKPPVITISSFERSGNLVRVSGVVNDNNRVSEVTVDGNRLNITPGPRVEFYAETTGIWADLAATDLAGNTTKLRAQ